MTHQTYPGHQPGQPQPNKAQDALDRLFSAARRVGVTRDSEEKWLGGVAAGLARRWAVDPLIVRAGLILITCTFGVGVPFYFIAWTLLPDDSGEIVAEKAVRHGHTSSIMLCIAAVTLSVGGFGAFWSIGPGWGLSGQAIGLAALAWAFLAWNGHGPGARRPDESTHAWSSRLSDAVRTRSSDQPTTPTTPPQPAPAPQVPAPYGPMPQSAGNRAAAAGAAAREGGIDLNKPAAAPMPAPPWPVVPARPKRRRLGAAVTLSVLGISVLAGAFTALVLVGTSHGDSALQVGLAAGAAVAAVALVIGGLAGRRGGVLGPLATIAVLLALLTAAVAPKGMPWTGTIGDESWRPTTVAQHNYAMRVGNGVLDLRGLDPKTIPNHTQLHARVNVGQLTITVPDDLTVRVQGYTHIGQIETVRNGERAVGHGGIDTHHTFTVGHGSKVVDLDADVGIGNITIKEARQ